MKNILLYLTLASLFTNCVKITSNDPSPSGPFTIYGHVLHGTSQQPFNVGERIYLYAYWTDWQTISHTERLGAATIQEDGSFEITYNYLEDAKQSRPIYELSSSPLRTNPRKINQTYTDTFYYSTAGFLDLSIDAPNFNQGDTLFLAVPSATGQHPVFDTLALPYHSFFKQYRMPKGRNIQYRINNPLTPQYDYDQGGFRGNDLHTIRSVNYSVEGDPIIDSLALKPKL
jgi:hypothetical protein